MCGLDKPEKKLKEKLEGRSGSQKCLVAAKATEIEHGSFGGWRCGVVLETCSMAEKG